MLSQHHQEHYDAFYESTHQNEYLDAKTEALVGLAAAMAMNCQPCTRYYLHQAKRAKVKRGEIAEVLAKVMAVAAGQKRLQAEEIVEKSRIDLNSFE